MSFRAVKRTRMSFDGSRLLGQVIDLICADLNERSECFGTIRSITSTTFRAAMASANWPCAENIPHFWGVQTPLLSNTSALTPSQCS